MEKNTVIAVIRAELTITDNFRAYLALFEGVPNAWFVRDEGEVFLREFGHEWNSVFIEYLQSFYGAHFRLLGLQEGDIPTIKLTDSRRGSWIMEAAIVMASTVGSTYAILGAVAELPKIADGLEDTKKRVQSDLKQIFGKRVRKRIEPVLFQSNSISALQSTAPSKNIPQNPVAVSFSIDARPLRSLTPDKIKSHAIHLSVGVSRSALSLENLGDTQLDNVRIGLFKSPNQRYSWSFADAYTKTIPILSPKQSLAAAVSDFLHYPSSAKLDFSDNHPLHVDCWVQDNNGIYLFNFYLK